MSSILINSGVNNYGGVPLIGANTLANRPAAGVVGRIFIGTDTNAIYRDTGTAWVTISSGVSGTAVAGQAAFWSTSTTISGDNAFFWDNTNKRLGINTNTPGVRLDVHGTGVIQQLNGTGLNNSYLDFQQAGSTQWRIGNFYNAGVQQFSIFNAGGASNVFTILQNGSVGIGINPTWLVSAYLGGANGAYMQFANGTTGPAQTNGTLYGVDGSGNGTIQVQGSFNFNLFVAGLQRFNVSSAGNGTFINRLNINNATDNALYELNNNGNLYTGGLSPVILTISGNTTMARTATGYYCTATLTLTLPSASGLNNVYWVIAGPGVTVTVNRAGSDDILNLAGVSVTSITILPNQRAMFYVGGGTRTFLISQA